MLKKTVASNFQKTIPSSAQSKMSKMMQKVRNIDQPTKDSVFGYCKTIPIDSDGDNKNEFYSIPVVIVHVILIYFYGNLKFNKEIHGDNLEFLDDKTVRKIKSNRESAFFFGEGISGKQCKIFNISLKWTKSNTDFFMGYIPSKPSQCIKNWNEEIGRDSNKQTSVGIFVSTVFQHFLLYDKDNDDKWLPYLSPQCFKPGDEFKMSFHFEDKKFIIFHNGNIANTLELQDHEAITPVFSLWAEGEEIEITKCEFL